MTNVSSRLDALGPRCRHYDARAGVVSGQDCGIGHPIRKIVTDANGGDSTGMAFMLPCNPGPERKAECPNYDPYTAKEIAESEAELRLSMNRFMERLPKIAAMKEKMINHSLSTAKATCPWCSKKDAFRLSCNLQGNKHVHGRCISCGEGFME